MGVRLGQQLRALPVPSFSQHVRYITLPSQSHERSKLLNCGHECVQVWLTCFFTVQLDPDTRDLGALEGELVAQQRQWSAQVKTARFQYRAATDIVDHIRGAWFYQPAYWRSHKLARAEACRAHAAKVASRSASSSAAEL